MTRAVGPARNVILTVDDDPGVSRAVARDLRRKYGESYRIVRAESGQAALEALRELKLRGDQVAVVLADYRMPQMNGVEFLEQALDVYPGARRVLLTAYADTSAAIDAINVIDLDHYLLKPWDPPEEKLYPVLDDLLQAWRAADRSCVGITKVVGHRWSARSSGVREFLARNQVPYRWFSSDEPEGRRLLSAAGEDGRRLPLVVTPDGTPLVEPEDPELAERVGLATTPASVFYDLVVIGGGPAGLGAAVYGASEGLRTLLVERSATGGQAGQSSRIENYLGFPDGVSGAQLTGRARRQATRFGAEILTAREVSGLEVNGAARTVRFSDGSAVAAHSVILATGVSYRQLDAPGCADLTGCGVFYGSALTEAPACQGHDVYIVGGANSAGQAAMYLARGAKSVTLLVRGDSLTASMSHYLIQQLAGAPNIFVRTGTVVEAAHGTKQLEQLTLKDLASGREELVDAQWLFVFIGAQPLTDWLEGAVLRDEHGFILTGPDMTGDGQPPADWELDRPPYHLETNVPGVFVAGDARAESAKRVASAVGEGAMAVMLVHRYLEQS
ncbi:FAD-dependent oxidoreductase [Streptomyces capitiformicae]|uniref:Fused response regulator/thioredoxin-disulfide reductase n=1 Tax=Streptomyces capitiformicae TaxID=2014920 RepID=A0A919GJB0_9ACTN|nr:FAD-dependent oxidoreductase [Streptomyces capitiformicae]GHH85850.1 fused response regulator/thioredoxin-disulfide reductase [Streptomyces capitiformicae]